MMASELHRAIARVEDPEFPGISIADLGLLETVAFDGSHVLVDLVPTFAGCPALDMIRADVEAAALEVPGVKSVAARFVNAPVWTPARITSAGRRALADGFTVAVQGEGEEAPCPRCGTSTTEQAAFGPTRCRAVHRCPNCHEVVEVVR